MEKRKVEQILSMIKACFGKDTTYTGEEIRNVVNQFLEYVKNYEDLG